MPDDTDPPAWEYLLSHHLPARYSRTLVLPLGARRVRLCARCTGQAVGLLVGLCALLLSSVLLHAISGSVAYVGIGLLPAPAAVDWYLQSVGRRESTNGIRLLTGALLGGALGIELVLLASLRLIPSLLGALLLFAYLLGILALLIVRGGWRRVIREHFPDIELPPGSD